MYTKHFIEQFWEGEQKDQLFVGMPFDGDEAWKFDVITKAAKKLNFKEGAFMQGTEKEAISIPEGIFFNIANSKMLLFDLSDDLRIPPQVSGQEYHRTNQNVMYELGVAMAIREPYEIALIRKKTGTEPRLPFDIRTININSFQDRFGSDFIEGIIKETLAKKELHRNKRIKFVRQSIDENSVMLMLAYGRIPNRNHFHLDPVQISPYKSSLLRLIDLGMIRFESSLWSPTGFEYAYHWTDFGYSVMEDLGIIKMNEKDFSGSKEEKAIKQADERFMEQKKNFLDSSRASTD